jgi:hypothetical protein
MYQRYTWCFCGLALALVAHARLRHTPPVLVEEKHIESLSRA